MEVLSIVIVFVLLGGFYFFFGLMWWRIFKKAGYHGALGILCLIPIANFIMLAILAFKEWPIRAQLQLKEGDAPQPKSLSVPLIVLIVIFASLPVMILLAAIAIPNLLRARLNANEASAIAQLKDYYAQEIDYKKQNFTYETIPDSENNGYYFKITSVNSDSFAIEAVPKESGVSGMREFVLDETGIIKTKDGEMVEK
jgi:hypothetical protein